MARLGAIALGLLYLGALLAPCPPSDARVELSLGTAAEPQRPHHDGALAKGHHATHAEPAPPPCRLHLSSELRVPCPCGCGGKAAAQRAGARLGLAIPSTAAEDEPVRDRPRRVAAIPQRPPLLVPDIDPIPI